MSCFDCNITAMNLNMILPVIGVYTFTIFMVAKFFIKNKKHQIITLLLGFVLFFANTWLAQYADPHLLFDTNFYSDDL